MILCCPRLGSPGGGVENCLTNTPLNLSAKYLFDLMLHGTTTVFVSQRKKKGPLKIKWVTSGHEIIDREIFRTHCEEYRSALETAKVEHYNSKLSNSNQRQLFRTCGEIFLPKIIKDTNGPLDILISTFQYFFPRLKRSGHTSLTPIQVTCRLKSLIHVIPSLLTLLSKFSVLGPLTFSMYITPYSRKPSKLIYCSGYWWRRYAGVCHFQAE